MNSVQAMVASESAPGLPDIRLSVRKTFGIDSDMEVAAYSQGDEHVPDFDPDYLFDRTRRSQFLRASPSTAA